MKNLTIEVQDAEFSFVTKLLGQFNFVKIKSYHNIHPIPDKGVVFSPVEFDEIYNLAIDESIPTDKILEKLRAKIDKD